MENIKEIINVNWEGPFSIDEILEDTIDNQKFEVKSSDIGLYQIYGSHPLYGSDVLVYIGRTKNKNGFKSRLKDRWVINNGNDFNNVKIYLGKIFSDSKKYTNEEINTCIEKAEVLMINALKPAFNSSNIQNAKDFDNNYIVYNHGSHRSLYPIFDSEYFWKEFKNFVTVDRIAKEYGTKKVENEDEYYGFVIEEFDSYTIWFGIDYKIWNSKEHSSPLCLQVYVTTNNTVEAVHNLKDFTKFDEYEDNSSVSYLPLGVDITKPQIDIKIQEIKEILEK